MKKVLFALTALAALALLAPNTVVAQGARNQVGVYITETPDLADLGASARLDQAGGQWSLYVVVTNPWNDNLDAAIVVLGGFEFQLIYPSAEWFITPTIHPSATNFQSAPDFYCGANAPVVNNMVTVITLACGSFGADPQTISVQPVSDANTQSIPGSIAVTDLNDNYSISELFPSSGDMSLPLFGYNTGVVPNEDVSFGGVKALFQ